MNGSTNCAAVLTLPSFAEFEAELTQSVRRIHEAIAPYTRFVRVEREKLEALDTSLREADQKLTQMHRAVGDLR